VVAKLRPADRSSIVGLSEHHRKLGLAIDYTIELLDLGSVEVVVRHWSDLDIAKGMGSSTADVLSGIRAIAAAAGEELDVVTQGELAAKVESSDGSMYPGIAAVNHKTCELIDVWDWYPEFVIVMLVPNDIVNTPSISFAGQQELATEYQQLLESMNQAIADRSIVDFARESTRSAIMNNQFLLNPFSRMLSDRLEDFGALGVNVGHTGTVCGLLFANTEDGRVKASDAYLEMRRLFPDLKDVKVVTTPYCGGPSSSEDGGQADEAGDRQQ
jgi:L-threonine kinase